MASTAVSVELEKEIVTESITSSGDTKIENDIVDEIQTDVVTDETITVDNEIEKEQENPSEEDHDVKTEPAPEQEEPQPQQSQAKLSGYLEKKGKLRVVSSWKKYWFVLEGRLLLYYRSRAEYDTLSPCKGSITLGAPCNIKPGPSSQCVFQIETRNNTITLRAENRDEQDKWMVAILGALNQTASFTNQTKLFHFRYSADDLALRKLANKTLKPVLTRQNTFPERIKEITQESKDTQANMVEDKAEIEKPQPKSIVERLQSIGAQSYTANMHENLKVSKASPKLPKNETLQKILYKQVSVTSDTGEVKDEWIKEEENELYVELNPTVAKIQEQEIVNNNQPNEVIIENQEYVSAIDLKEVGTGTERHIYQEIGVENQEIHFQNYCQVDVASVDHNKNKVEYAEPIYASNGSIYSTIPTEPALPPRPKLEDASQKDEEKAEKKVRDAEKSKRVKKLAKMVKEERKESGKRQSFVARIFKKIKKDCPKPENKEDEAVKETPHPNTPVPEQEDIQNIPENVENETQQEKENVQCEIKADGLVEELKEVLAEKLVVHNEEEITTIKEENVPINEETNNENESETKPKLIEAEWIQEDVSLVMANLNTKVDDPKISEDLPKDEKSNQKEPARSPPLEQPQLPLKQKHIDQKALNANENAPNNQPYHTKSSEYDYDIYDSTQRLNIPRPKLLTKSKRPKRLTNIGQNQRNEPADDQLVTIDEILDDLENHKYEPFSRQKVKELIEKFNENDTEHDTDEEAKDEGDILHVQLRRKPINYERNSEELGSLLDELGKVTNAPVIQGTTNSMGVNGPFSEDEWKNIVPIRKRRHSDPDYDIPRPHSALQIIPSSEKPEAKMQPTRFFGPVIIEQLNCDSTSCGTSMTPDSLEVDMINDQSKNYTPSIEEDRSMRSYTSHIYSSTESHLNPNSKDKAKSDLVGKEEIYPKPKPLSSLIGPKTECEHAFYLNLNNNNNNNHTNNLNINMNISPKANIIADAIIEKTDELTNSICLDSLEPSSEYVL